MTINEKLVEVREYTGTGYKPVIDFGNWRVAVLRWAESTQAQTIDRLERHDETDEVFVLMRGKCILVIGEEHSNNLALHGLDMLPFKIYNVKQSCWHACVLSPDAEVLIVENKDTSLSNSPRKMLDAAQRERVIAIPQELWG